MSMNFNNITILKIKNSDYRCIVSGIRKSEAIKLLENIIWSQKVEYYKK